MGLSKRSQAHGSLPRRLVLSVFLGMIVAFTVTIIVLVREGSPLVVALAVPAVVLSAAGSAALFVHRIVSAPGSHSVDADVMPRQIEMRVNTFEPVALRRASQRGYLRK